MVRDLLREIRNDGTTVLLSSHDLAEVATLADRVAIFIAGKLAASGSIDDLMQQHGVSLQSTQSALEAVYRTVMHSNWS